MFKTMGFLLKIGRFRTRANSPETFANNPEGSSKSVCKHLGRVPGSSERFPVLTQSAIFKTMGYSPGYLLKIGVGGRQCVSSRKLGGSGKSCEI